MLEVRDLHAGYGRVPILRGVSFSASPGKVLLIVGPNGAGKSTLLRTVQGFIKPTAGSVLLDGKDIGGLAPEEVTRLGMRLVLDGHRIFPDLSVADNIRLGATFRRGDMRDMAEPALQMFPILREKLHHPARGLSGGQQQMLALAQAFMAQPKVLLCDEPSLGLAQALMPSILNFLAQWAAAGTAVVIVEQHVDLALRLADQVLRLQGGEVEFYGSAATFSAAPAAPR